MELRTAVSVVGIATVGGASVVTLSTVALLVAIDEESDTAA
ncbi:MAG: hypothetical protein Q7L55_08800 [Actinomycetota bacterium]|nr:hypothetical protein [Actinomycetota bacterium]